MSLPFLLEIGTEEIPDWMIEGALDQLATNFQDVLRANELDAPRPPVFATPRRLTMRASALPEQRPEKKKTETGPLVSAGAKAAEGFAKRYRVSVEELTTVETPMGAKYAFEKPVPAESMLHILESSLQQVILDIRWPKTMYWTAQNGPRFIRPIRWIVALLGDDVIPFEIAGLKSGNLTSGHRILGAPQIPVTIQNYEQKLRENFVILSAEDREKHIRAGVSAVQDDALLNTLVYLTEYPSVISGTFDREYLKLPAEVLVTVMRHHQRYFAVYENGQLTNRFFAVINTDGDPDGLIRRGNERVLRARFNDAKFFWETDQRKPLAARVEDLSHVTFQAKLGSYLEKTRRMQTLVAELGGDREAIRAAELSKCDLTTELVKEFTELQGVVGGLYARAQGEPEQVATAIYDHYKPVSIEDSIPRNHAGQIVSIADKLDTLRGCFQIGLIPTGSKDPFALRRAAQGVVKILVEGALPYSLKTLLGGDAKLQEFLLDRVRYYFKEVHQRADGERGYPYDEVAAVLAAGWDDLVDVEARLTAVHSVRLTENFEPVATSFRRIRNILRQAGVNNLVCSSSMTPSHPAEQALWKSFSVVDAIVADFRKTKNYREALKAIANLRPDVDKFFEQVLVNDPDEGKRHARLALLSYGLKEFSTIADFSEIVTNT